jgi:hypothetical protein
MKEVMGQQKSKDKQSHQRKAAKSFKPDPDSLQEEK